MALDNVTSSVIKPLPIQMIECLLWETGVTRTTFHLLPTVDEKVRETDQFSCTLLALE